MKNNGAIKILNLELKNLSGIKNLESCSKNLFGILLDSVYKLEVKIVEVKN